GTDQAVMNGDLTNDTFNVSETQTTFNGTDTVNYTTSLEKVNVNGLLGNDTFNVSPSRYASILIDGGSPSFGEANAPGGTPNGPGDVINFNALGNSAQIQGNVIAVAGGSPAFQGVAFQDIEKVCFPTLGMTTAHYDFNLNASSSTQSGYTAVLPTRLYGTGTPGSDFGWVTTLPIGGFDRGAVPSAFSNLVRDGQYSGTGAAGAPTFRTDLTNRYYAV